MMNDSVPIVKDLVLVGGGHSHVTVLKRFGMRPMPGVRLTLICRELHTPYSGMLPGLIAGHYSFDEAHIDLGPLSRFARARLYHDEVVGLDLVARKVVCRNRPAVPYDLLSINIGSTPSLNRIAGAEGSVVPVKPISRFVERWEKLKKRIVAAGGKARIAVIGAGAGGVELTLAMQYHLRRLLANTTGAKQLSFHLFASDETILPTQNEGIRARFRRMLQTRGVNVHLSSRVKSVNEGELRSESGEVSRFDEILWVTNAGAAGWIRESGLAVDDAGFLAVEPTLRSTSCAEVFAAGDISSVLDHPREKAGVFAVRQGRPLERNLRRALLGQPLRPFQPQKKYLSLISTGDRYAIASRGNWSLEGRWVWRWKDWIDRRFMDKYNVLPDMDAEKTRRGNRLPPGLPAGLVPETVREELTSAVMRCGGCGAKVGATVLSRVLANLQPYERADVLIGLHAPDDSAAVAIPEGKVLIQTVDSFRAIVDDPYLFGKIAANHSLGDIYAMGAEPQSALAIATVPHGVEEKIEATLTEMLTGALEVFEDARTALVGGHTSEGAELSLGFSINGLADPAQILRKGGLRPGDRLILTKPIGTGTLFAADMRLKAKARWIAAALDSMLQSNRGAAECLRRHGATACTDVTGFGMLGHLVEMLKPTTELGATIRLAKIPILDGALETSAAGILSSLQPENVRLRRAIRNQEEARLDARYPLIFDPQTAGGLLAGVPADAADGCVEELRTLGYEKTSIIGTVTEAEDSDTPVTVAP